MWNVKCDLYQPECLIVGNWLTVLFGSLCDYFGVKPNRLCICSHIETVICKRFQVGNNVAVYIALYNILHFCTSQLVVMHCVSNDLVVPIGRAPAHQNWWRGMCQSNNISWGPGRVIWNTTAGVKTLELFGKFQEVRVLQYLLLWCKQKQKNELVTVEVIINSTQTVGICYLGLKD